MMRMPQAIHTCKDRYHLNVANPVNSAFGAQVRALREASELSQDRLARAVTRAGVRWSRARLGQVEAGDAAPDLVTMCALAAALGELTGAAHRLADLLPKDGEPEVMELRRALLGEPVFVSTPSEFNDPRLDPGWGQVEDRVAVELPGQEAAILTVSRDLYGHTGTQERDARASEGATAQKRGRLTRVVMNELLVALRD